MPHLPSSLTLRTTDVVLRDWAETDAPALELVSGDSEVYTFTSVPRTYSPVAAREWVQRQHDRRATGTGLSLAITQDGEPLPLGNVNLVRFSVDAREAALGYWVAPAARGRGLASAAARTLCAWGFAELHLTRIELAILPTNTASLRVAQRLGAISEGQRLGAVTTGGRAWDMEILSLPSVNLR